MSYWGRFQPFVAVTRSNTFAMPAKGILRPEIAVRSRIGQGPLPDREAAVRMTLARSPVPNAGTPAVKDDQTVSVLCPGFFIAITNSDHACSLPGRMRSPGKQPHQPTFSTLSAKNSLSFGPCSRSACGSGNGPSLGLALAVKGEHLPHRRPQAKRRRLPLHIGEVGEIGARSYAVMIGCNEDPEATAATIDRDGWLRTGDLGTMDAEGFVRDTGRVKDMIIRGGQNHSVGRQPLLHPLQQNFT
jgi:acyl-CoA synthetase (AMP-forming)/AMP-acid ligase II